VEFEWHANKAAENLRKHKVSFVEAATVFVKTRKSKMKDELRPEYDLGQLLKGRVRGRESSADLFSRSAALGHGR
jgi:uncharacterized DUF497 family protein